MPSAPDNARNVMGFPRRGSARPPAGSGFRSRDSYKKSPGASLQGFRHINPAIVRGGDPQPPCSRASNSGVGQESAGKPSFICAAFTAARVESPSLPSISPV
jgi:hypothetical protein